MHPLRIATLALFVATLAACTVSPRPVVVSTPPPVVQTTPPPVVMGAPASPTTVEVPVGHFPPPGQCRIWVPGVAPGQQELPGSCADLQNRVPPGAILLRG